MPASTEIRAELEGKIRQSLRTLADNGRLTQESYVKTIHNWIKIEYALDPVTSYEDRVFMLQLGARLQNRFLEFSPDTQAIPAPTEFDDYPDKLEGLTFVEGTQTFFDSLGDQAEQILGPNLKALAFVVRNAYWIAPIGVGIYFAPTIKRFIQSVR